MTDLELFFEDPTKQPYLAGEAWTDPRNPGRTGRKFGTLYHLRRNIDHCFGDLSPESEVPAPWPGALCIMAGIDLLSILFAGESNNQRVSADHPQKWKYSNEGRFTEYVKRFFQESEKQHAGKLWMLRNTLMHCFGVNSRAQSTKFVLTADPSALALLTRVPPQNQNLYSVDLCKLKTSFEEALETYRSSLIPANTDVMANFDNKFADYGWMIVCPSPTNPNALTSATPPMLTVHSLGLSVTNQSLSTFCRAASGQQF